MAIKWKHYDQALMYFCTFTCYSWLNLFDIVNGYDLVYKWFDVLKKQNHQTVAYVIMPNHVHLILYFPETGYNLNKLFANGKRFMAYEIVDRLFSLDRFDILKLLNNAVSNKKRQKGQHHRVFEDSFDAKAIYTEKFLSQKLNYIHLNPVRGKWNLAKDFTMYEHSSASFYELGQVMRYQPFDYRLL